jgi:3-oxoadipate enol-lactonase
VLARRRLVIVPDLPGHGDSGMLPGEPALADYAQAVLDAIAPLELGTFAVAGLSFGGMVAQSLALAVPERVQRLVLAHCGAHTNPAVAQLWRQRIAAARLEGMAAQASPTLARWFTPEFLAQAHGATAWVGQMVADTPVDGYVAAALAICGLDHHDQLGALRIPTLVIGGGRDMAVPLEVSEDMANRLPQAEFLALADAAHIGNVEQAMRFTEALCAFLRD